MVVPVGLRQDLLVELAPVLGSRVVGDPLIEVLGDVHQVAHPQFAGTYRVITQILLYGRRIETALYLLHAVAVDRVALMAGDKLLQHLALGKEIVLQLREDLIPPLDGVVVKGAKVGRVEGDPFVLPLSHIIPPRIVHDTGCGAVLVGKGGRPKRVDGVGG